MLFNTSVFPVDLQVETYDNVEPDWAKDRDK